MGPPDLLPASEGYALWAETWDATPSPVVAVEERMVRPWIERLNPRRAVDVGCGTGRWTARLGAIGIDASCSMLIVASRKPQLRGRLAAGDAAALPLASGSSDTVLCALTLGHVRNRAAALREFVRVLEPGGSLILTDFHPDAAARRWRRTFRHQERLYELEHFPYSLDEIREAAPELALAEFADGFIGEPERGLFAEAGRPELFRAACGTPAVLLARWTRR